MARTSYHLVSSRLFLRPPFPHPGDESSGWAGYSSPRLLVKVAMGCVPGPEEPSYWLRPTSSVCLKLSVWFHPQAQAHGVLTRFLLLLSRLPLSFLLLLSFPHYRLLFGDQ